jgi:hypothetical protein
MFDEAHLFLSFEGLEDRKKYWVGRLVQCKSPIRINLFEKLPRNMVGVVTDIEENIRGLPYILIVRWANGRTVPCYQCSIYSQKE